MGTMHQIEDEHATLPLWCVGLESQGDAKK
jgi:hypothetical protein